MTDHSPDRLDEIIAAFQRLPIPDPPDPAELRARLTAGSEVDPERTPVVLHPLRTWIMRPSVRYSTAAAVVLAALGWLALNSRPTVALADVVRATEQHKLARFQVREIYDYPQHLGIEAKKTAYADLTAPRLRFEQKMITLGGVLQDETVVIQDNTRDRWLMLKSGVELIPEEKADASQLDILRTIRAKGSATKRAYLSRLAHQQGQPFFPDELIKRRPLLDSLRQFQDNPATRSDQAELNGRSVRRYRLQEATITTTLWVDPQTKLPLRIETEMIRPFTNVVKLVAIYADFEWDPAGVDPARLFSTDVPPGYVIKQDFTTIPVVPVTTQPVPRATNPPRRVVSDQELKPDSPESAAVLKFFEEKIAMQFPNDVPLQDVLEYISVCIKEKNQAGLPFAFDAAGLKQAGRTSQSLVSIDESDKPLKTTLRQLLQPLGLTYEVRRGVLTVTAE